MPSCQRKGNGRSLPPVPDVFAGIDLGSVLFEPVRDGEDDHAEAPRHADGLARFDHVLQRYAWDALEFLPRPVTGQVEKHPDRGLGKRRIVPSGLNAHVLELFHHPPVTR